MTQVMVSKIWFSKFQPDYFWEDYLIDRFMSYSDGWLNHHPSFHNIFEKVNLPTVTYPLRNRLKKALLRETNGS